MPNESSRFESNFLALLEAKRAIRDRLLEKNDVWTFDNENLIAFDNFFRNILKGKSIADVVDVIKQKKGLLKA
ncbi:MAG: hypothetical protein COU63_00150 [Candidatus Pacebacteria bacterium CG10_big_fil_rev_8_21_14_0_10_36_11]|nr:hypothetical protein [Candidatus Pacearchaeota archaeon]OIP74170.1 MAG: hypothetical protein AUK08_02900 [Candidatus Pacebacteria bacterium CG2_30_36_39]PIR65073.1 MAG: hypothetical protein COU63_00150 [Candidatus Pacebacteria bacterium CG10_big_fil_rev_8_21_14_0_10_36_11]PJC43225.1 MAG: hypothetical protein CO040_00205 [Candidatus Pacebacteria bacterium CG_4_9_14_0_2_um_filter_36_8]